MGRGYGILFSILFCIVEITLAASFSSSLQVGWSSLGEAACGVDVKTPHAPAHAGVLAEPHKVTRFELSVACSSGGGGQANVMFRSRGPAGQVADGPLVDFTFSTPGLAELHVALCPAEHVDSNAQDDATWCSAELGPAGHIVPVAVTYVRREIRALPPPERRAYFGALHLMANVSTRAGRALYGPKYYNYYELVARHAAAVQSKCDLGHFGPAFITFHRAFTREFEACLQAINPQLAAPYWDYQTDALLADPATSEIFSDEFYGSMVGDPSDHHLVKDGQFAFWRVPSGAEARMWARKTWGRLGPNRMGNPFGFLRRPDNMNASPSLSRYRGTAQTSQGLPSLAAWERCRNMTLVGPYVLCLATSGTHPSVHSLIGGDTGLPTFEQVRPQLNCSKFGSEAACKATFESVLEMSSNARANAYMDGCLTCHASCTNFTQSASNCACTCHLEEERCDPANVMRRTIGKMMAAGGGYPPGIKEGLDFATYGVCAKLVVMGDYLDLSASVLDPIFWLHHVNLDRLHTSWRRAHPEEAWEALGFTYPSREPAVYPDYLSANNIVSGPDMYPGVFPPGNENPSGVCEGHGLFDEVGKGAFVGVFSNLPAGHPHTNLEILRTIDIEMKDPSSADYVYDRYV
eukprot:jgi/Mesen1/5295/ME000264S04326